MRKKIFIQHRVNQSRGLAGLSRDYGAEIDLRSDVSNKNALHLSHDPWILGEDFATWLAEYRRCGLQGPLILNTKEDGLESRCLELLHQHGIQNYFFLDTALPTLVRWTQKEGNPNFALRLSAFEPVASLEPFKGKAQWVWVDCFQAIPMSASIVEPLKSHFKICLVSPELQGATLDHLKLFSDLYRIADAVCTKSPQKWIETFEKT